MVKNYGPIFLPSINCNVFHAIDVLGSFYPQLLQENLLKSGYLQQDYVTSTILTSLGIHEATFLESIGLDERSL